LADTGLRSQIHSKKSKGKPMSEAISPANGRKSKIRAFVGQVFARQKGPMGLVVTTTGLPEAAVQIELTNLNDNTKLVIRLLEMTVTA